MSADRKCWEEAIDKSSAMESLEKIPHGRVYPPSEDFREQLRQCENLTVRWIRFWEFYPHRPLKRGTLAEYKSTKKD